MADPLVDNGESSEQWLRVGLGFLLPLRDWNWWHHPEIIAELLIGSATAKRLSTWGGGQQLMQPTRWLDRARSAQIIRATKALARANLALTVQLNRELWTWANPEELASLRSDIAALFPDSIQFFMWPKDRKPRRLYPTRSQYGQLVVSGSEATRQVAAGFLQALPNSDWSEQLTPTDIVIASAEDASRYPSVDLVILVQTSNEAALSTLDKFRSNGARCVIHAVGEMPEVQRWLQVFADRWQYMATSDAVYDANIASGQVAEIVAANTTFLKKSIDILRYAAEGNHASGFVARKSVKGIANSSEETLLLKSFIDPPPKLHSDIPAARVLDASVLHDGHQTTRLPKDGNVVINLKIRYRTLFDDTRPSFPVHRIQWDRPTKPLQVYMVAVGRPLARAEFELPQRGESSAAKFEFAVLSEQVDIRFIVADGARIVQTARLKGTPGDLFEFSVESASDNLERDKQPFEFALLVNDSLGGRPSATALDAQGISLTMLDNAEISAARESLLSQIGFLVKNPSIQPDATFYDLANAGKRMLDGLRGYIPNWPENLGRVQLTTQSNAYFPLEFFYQGRIPRNRKAPLCPERASCFAAGEARAPCSIRQENQKLCPMGFIGVTAIIERQTWTPGLSALPWLSAAKDFDQRHKIASLDKAAFAASRKAESFLAQNQVAGMPTVTLNDVAKEVAPLIEDWDAWEAAIQSNPSLLALIPHIDKDHLYIGQGDSLSFGAMEIEHIGSGKPVVIAMGCSSALSPVALASLPSTFLRLGASAVIAALTELLGRHATIVTLEMVKILRDATKATNATTIGDVISTTRREMLSKNLAIGLVLVAFGDADFILGGK
ncbi:hypothetical protein FHW83_003297 [Duganella sp. SG902]|uniref:hypothetical protein n=1 Tax=Duganella sp. SG902 TaxID=2587016 RepID=UPI00159D0666|nr:hypothetical protein [Duganella sp. SG902]NVM77479.1 hypothetical protein [Duganella sp. SG902]